MLNCLRLTETVHNSLKLEKLIVTQYFHLCFQLTQHTTITHFIISRWPTVNALTRYDQHHHQQQPSSRHGNLWYTDVTACVEYGTYPCIATSCLLASEGRAVWKCAQSLLDSITYWDFVTGSTVYRVMYCCMQWNRAMFCIISQIVLKRETISAYTLCPKTPNQQFMAVTLSNLNRFSTFFHREKNIKLSYRKNQCIVAFSSKFTTNLNL